MADPDQLNVRERAYSDDSAGPAADTVAFSKQTPAPGERRLLNDGHSQDSSILPPKATQSTGNMPSISITGTGGHPEVKEAGFPVHLALGGLLFLGVLAAAGAFAVATLSASAPAEDQPTQQEIDEVMGVPVEKGFKNRSPG